jgi:hypothetical protein
VQSYREDNERMIRAQEEMLQSLNMLQRQVNKYFGTKQAASARQVEASRSHDRRDDHGGSRRTRSVSRHHHHSPGHSTRRAHAHSRSESIPCVPCQTSEEETWVRYFARRAQESSSHHILMEIIGREKMLKLGCWE